MNKTAIFVFAIAVFALAVVAGCASVDPAVPTSATGGASSQAGAQDPAQPIQASVQQVQVETFSDDLKCSRQQPTGSRIAIKTCEAPATKAEEELRDYVTRDEVDRMRRQIIYAEQQRQAQEAAMRGATRPGGGP